MKINWLWLSLLLTGSAAATSTSDSSWVINEGENSFVYESHVPLVGSVKLRAGYYRENINSPASFKGCVLYLEGLGDSMMNHADLFQTLSDSGYRVITFDYMGQGGSQGSMNHTRIIDSYFPALQISRAAEQVWEKYAAMQDPISGKDCSQSKKIVIGWSTGGLAAYEMANRGWADAVVLINPGIAPKKFIGEAAEHPELLLKGEPVITERTLTRLNPNSQYNPHVDTIKPNTPVKVPLFTANLVYSAKLSQKWVINPSVKGLLLVSGVEDTYVDNGAAIQKIRENAPHFIVRQFSGGPLHELDNELPQLAALVHADVVDFIAQQSN